MQTRQTELARIETMLRQQLARAETAERPDRSRPSALGRLAARLPWLQGIGSALPTATSLRSFIGELFSKPRSLHHIESGIAALRRKAAARLDRKRKAYRLEELHELLAARRKDHAPQSEEQRPAAMQKPRRRSALFDAAQRERALTALFAQGDASAGRTETAFAAVRPETRRLPNLSGNGASVRTMKDVPERDWGPPPAVQFPMQKRKSDHRSDLVIAGLGVALGLVCALFPWYIFFNQDQFGVQAIRFGGRGGNAGRATVEARPGDQGKPVVDQEIPDSALDLFATGTLQARPESADTAPSLDQQPFPAEAAKFRLVHIANGRAMIEDDAGLWIVQRGSVLPDSSTVKSIEQRKGHWVLVTSTDRVLEISK